ncbi:MAG: ATP-dependent helicase [Streptomycetaceae bacterium]|nr:ATP-dependent helicase [Streptomycetaceae bacterium]
MASRITEPEELKELLHIPFTAEQLACITAPLAPNVIVAGAGSGKTTVMAARVVWLVGTGQVALEQVLGLTFTNKAAGELAERIRKALVEAGVMDPDPAADPPGDPRISTYHAFAGQLLKDHGLRIGLEPGARLLADATRYQLAARVLRAAPGPYPALTKSLSALAADLLALDAELAEHLVTVEALREHDAELAEHLSRLDPDRRGFAWVREVALAVAARRDLAGLVAAYREQKTRRDLLDFGDQIALAAELARTRPEVGHVLRKEFAVVLLDEYQDTSVAQRLLLTALFGDFASEDSEQSKGGAQRSGTGHPVTAVGDPCQAIYGWRGASVANLDDFPRHFRNADSTPAHRHALSENRRSGGRLLQFANALAAPLRRRHEGVEALQPAPGAEHDGVVRCALLPTYAEEIAWIADSICHLTATGTPPGEIAILCRTAGQFADLHAALVTREIPVEVVGLSGLLHLPEIADLVATCEVLHDPAANASLVRLLTGPRWRIGPRDLALLGRRARLQVRHAQAESEPDRLAEAVEGVDPAEAVSLADALETFLHAEDSSTEKPDADLPFSPQARIRFARLATEIRELRRSLADPLMDVLHRILAVTGLDVEMSASPHALAARRRETLHAFLDIAAGFASLDGEATLLAFLAFLRTAEQHEKGLDSSLPGGENTVKVLTAHKSKGLEWDVVAVPGLVKDAFPSARVRELWPWHGKVLPHALRGDAPTLPEVPEWSKQGLDAFKEAMKDHNATEELRLGYVTFTRPRSLLLASGHWWGPGQKKPRGPSDFLQQLREHCEAGHGEIEHWTQEPTPGTENPALDRTTEYAWPLPLDPDALDRRRQAAKTVLAHLDGVSGSVSGSVKNDAAEEESPAPGLPPEEARLIASWDRDLEALAGELRRSRTAIREVPLPASLTASQVMRLAADPDGFARELARPMPRPPQPAARRGTRFHTWVESRFDELPLLELEELPGMEPGAADEIADEKELQELKEAFLRTPYANRTPYRVEVPFQLSLAGRVIRGRIDAIYKNERYEGYEGHEASEENEETGDYEIVDWKTSRAPTADPLQLAIYRLAWAEQHGLPPERVRAAFVYIRTGQTVRLDDLPDRPALERLLLGEGP